MELGFFGKLPSRADFVRYNATAPVFRSFDDWIQSGLRYSDSGRYAGFEQAYNMAGPSGFLFRPRGSQESLVGVIRPSRDQAGRKYPFFIAAAGRVQSIAEYGHVIDVARELVTGAIHGEYDAAQLTERLQNSNILDRPGTASSGLGQVTLGALCEQLWGSFYDSRKYAAFKNMQDLLLPLRGQGQPSFSYGLKLPLASGELHAASVEFWLEICSALLGISELTSSLIWNLGSERSAVGQTGGSPYLYVFFSQLLPVGFLGIAQLDADADELYTADALNNRNAAELALSIPEHIGRIIESENMTLADVANGFRSLP